MKDITVMGGPSVTTVDLTEQIGPRGAACRAHRVGANRHLRWTGILGWVGRHTRYGPQTGQLSRTARQRVSAVRRWRAGSGRTGRRTDVDARPIRHAGAPGAAAVSSCMRSRSAPMKSIWPSCTADYGRTDCTISWQYRSHLAGCYAAHLLP
jgi:hypothetical protein